MNKLLAWLMARLECQVDGDEPEEVEEEPEEVEEEPEEVEEEPEETEEEPAPKPQSRAQKEIVTLRERAQKAESDHQKAMTELENARRESRPQQPSQDQKTWQQEEAILASPEANDWQRYAIQSARDARQANANSQHALRESRDQADKTAFERIAVSKPKAHAMYKDKVESMLKEMRSKGNDAPREKLMALLMGEDMIAGKFKATEGKSTKTSGVKRGSTPGVKSDVRGTTGRLSDAEKRTQRLENVRI
jgi:hypothetical protein